MVSVEHGDTGVPPVAVGEQARRLWHSIAITLAITLAFAGSAAAGDLKLEVTQLTAGPQHHFFGYIGQSLTTPWNASGRYILSLRTKFHDRMPRPGEAAEVVLLDSHNEYRASAVEKCRAWNFQQGTMFYWNPKEPETQFFFNDRDPETNVVFTVLYDVEKRKRVREYRFADVPVANGGVSPTGEFFLAINYGRIGRLRPTTGYPGAVDPTAATPAPENDGIFRVDIDTGARKLLVSFRQLRELLREREKKIDTMGLYINHSLCSRDGKQVYFFARGARDGRSMALNVPCSVRTDGSELKAHQHIGGHPEWDEGTVVIGSKDGRQVRYDINRQEIVGTIASREIIPEPEGDVALSADGNWFVCGYSLSEDGRTRPSRDCPDNQYVIVRRSDGAFVRSPKLSREPYRDDALRIDPAPRWNRKQTAILVPGMTDDRTRQLFLLEIEE